MKKFEQESTPLTVADQTLAASGRVDHPVAMEGSAKKIADVASVNLRALDEDKASIESHFSLETSSNVRPSYLVPPGGEAIESGVASRQMRSTPNFLRVISSKINPKPEGRLVALDAKNPTGAEFGLLAARLDKFKAQGHLKRVLVAACNSGSGGSLVSANLALTLAQNPDRKVLLLEGNLGHPSLGGRLGLHDPEGLSEYLQGSGPVENFVRAVSPGGFWFMSAGTPPHDQKQQIQILHSPRLSILLRIEADWFDWVVVDSPPLETWVMARAFTQLSDGLLVVVRKGHTTKKLLHRSLDMLDGTPVLGFAFNESTP